MADLKQLKLPKQISNTLNSVNKTISENKVESFNLLKSALIDPSFDESEIEKIRNHGSPRQTTDYKRLITND